MKKFFVFMFCAVMLLASNASAVNNITPSDAYSIMMSNPNAYMLDVRTSEEWIWVGHPGPDKTGVGSQLKGRVFNIAYKINYKGKFIDNPSFLTDVAEKFKNKPNALIIIICRSGIRSLAAGQLLVANGYNAANVLDGFEGQTDSYYGYRILNGWKIEGYPYNYNNKDDELAYRD